ncbi:hypothetical protein ACWGJ9_07280 [Curtobacterium citreum]
MTTDHSNTCPPDHKHGGTVTCYNNHRCRCAACREAHRGRARQVRRDIAYGRHSIRELVDASPVRQHIRRLGAFGIGVRQLGEISGVSPKAMNNLLYGATGQNHPRHGILPKRTGADIARRVLAVRADPAHLAPGTTVPARGARRRLQALMYQGWTQPALAARLGVSKKRVSFIATATPGVTKSTHERIAALFDELWDKRPPQNTEHDRTQSLRTRHHAIAAGWVSPLAWDDIDLDDAPALAERGKDDVDESAVDLALTGTPVRLTQAERREAVRTLHAAGLTDPTIAARLGCSDRTVLRDRDAMGLPYNDNPYTSATRRAA